MNVSYASTNEWPYSLALTTAATVEPVSLNEVRDQCRISVADDDAVLLSMIRRARRKCEKYLERQFCTATWTLTANGFPCASDTNPFASIPMPKPPLVSATISYMDVNGASQTFAASNYSLEKPTDHQGKIHLAYGSIWPTVQSHPTAVTIPFVAGYGAAAAVPETIKEAIAALACYLYENRGDEETKLPEFITWMLDSESWGTGF